MKRHDDIVRWDMQNGRSEALCRMRVFDDLIFPGRAIVVLSDALGNKGKSVINGIELLCERAARKYELNIASTTFIAQDSDENFDVVTFESVRSPFIQPNCNRIEWPVLRRSLSNDAAGTFDRL